MLLTTNVIPFLEDLKKKNVREWFKETQKPYNQYKKDYK